MNYSLGKQEKSRIAFPILPFRDSKEWMPYTLEDRTGTKGIFGISFNRF